MFDYAVKGLKLSESVSYNFIQVARKSFDVPELKEAIQSQSLSITSAKRIAPILTSENKSEWIEKARALPSRELEKQIARAFPERAQPERIKFTGFERVDVSLNISEETLEKLKRVQDLLSQKQKKHITIEEALVALTSEFIERHDPLEKAKRVLSKKESPTKSDKTPVARQVPQPQVSSSSFQSKVDSRTSSKATSKKRVARPAALNHRIHARDQLQCTATLPNGSRCASRRWLEVHHLTPVEAGGKDELSNLITLCRAHHTWEHPL